MAKEKSGGAPLKNRILAKSLNMMGGRLCPCTNLGCVVKTFYLVFREKVVPTFTRVGQIR